MQKCVAGRAKSAKGFDVLLTNINRADAAPVRRSLDGATDKAAGTG